MSYGVKLENGHRVSRRAADAIEEGRMKFPQARKVVRLALGCSKEIAEHLLHLTGCGEWHHVGNSASRVNFYDPQEAIEFYKNRPSGKYACAAWQATAAELTGYHANPVNFAYVWANSQGWLKLEIEKTGISVPSARWA